MLSKLQWIVIPGGPGLSNLYLKYALKSVPDLHFYDMHGSPESHKQFPSIPDMVQQIHQVACENKLKSYGLLTHSFGSYLAIRALQSGLGGIKAVIMLNPIPFEFSVWRATLAKFSEIIPASILKEISILSKSDKLDAGIKLFHLIFPYYLGRKKFNLPLNVPFNARACNLIADNVAYYDDRAFVSSAIVPIMRIVGEQDLFFSDYDILSEKTIVIPQVGHYPFFEAADIFHRILEDKIGFLQSNISKVF